MSNVISVCNAGKRNHGENHWFWAVWVDVDHKKFTGQSPAARGFDKWKGKARRAGWAAIIARVSDKQKQRAYYNLWTRDLLRKEKEDDQRPTFSRCSIGKHKWFWVVKVSEEITVSGFSDSAVAAQQDAEAQFGSVAVGGNWMAKGFRQKHLAIERSKKTSDCETAASIELIYECHRYCGDFDDSDTITPYRIVKRTKTRIYVDCEPYREYATNTGEWTDYLRRTFVLNRAEFESTGKTDRRCRGWGRETFYAHPDIYFADRRSLPRPECFVVLGVPADANENDVKRAFKQLAKRVHPDAGGDPEEFKAVYAAYERAMELIASKA